MKLSYVITDVFTDRRFGGNQLAVVLDAAGLTTEQMQAVAREFNFSETTFVLPPEDPANTRRVRIFTPSREIPFAGHPNVGTACVLAERGEAGGGDGPWQMTFEEDAGLVTLEVRRQCEGILHAEFTAPRAPTIGAEIDPELVAVAVGLTPASVVTSRHAPRLASAGMAFVCVEIDGREALARARPDADALARLPGHDAHHGSILVYTRDAGVPGADVRARMFALDLGVPEDPATGSAAAALSGLLGRLSDTATGEVPLAIAQGIEMGRPSRIETTAVKAAGEVTAVRVAGPAVTFAEGTLHI